MDGLIIDWCMCINLLFLHAFGDQRTSALHTTRTARSLACACATSFSWFSPLFLLFSLDRSQNRHLSHHHASRRQRRRATSPSTTTTTSSRDPECRRGRIALRCSVGRGAAVGRQNCDRPWHERCCCALRCFRRRHRRRRRRRRLATRRSVTDGRPRSPARHVGGGSGGRGAEQRVGHGHDGRRRSRCTRALPPCPSLRGGGSRSHGCGR